MLFVAGVVSLTPDTSAASAAFRTRIIALANRAPPELPLATGNGLRFLELREGTETATAQRLVFIRTPPGVDIPDPTNEHQVERWKTVDPRLPVMSLASFLAANSRFLVLSDCSAIDLLPKLLADRGFTLRTIARTGCAELSEAVGSIGK
jgi:hypothetical protein